MLGRNAGRNGANFVTTSISSYPLDGDTPNTLATVSALRNSGSSS